MGWYLGLVRGLVKNEKRYKEGVTTPVEAQYVTYYGVHLNHYSYTWGGTTYHKLLTKEYPSEELQSTASTQTDTATFLYPRLVGNPTYIDGVAEGHITLFNSSSGASATLDDYTVTLKKTDDVPNNETTLGTYAYTPSGDNIIWKNGEVSDDGTKSDTLVLPVYIPISKKKVDVDEKLLLTISYNSTNGTVWIGHYNGTSPDDIKISIPYVPSG